MRMLICSNTTSTCKSQLRSGLACQTDGARKEKDSAMAPTTPDHDEIVRVVQLYIDGFNDRDIAKFKEAFHESAWIFFTEPDGTLYRNLLTNCFQEWVSGPSETIVGRVISVQQAGDVAVVLLGFDNATDPPSSWVDIHSLLRLNGVWKIMNKTATHSSRAAWAGAEAARQQDAPTPTMAQRQADRR
jgi:hypothetical protein